MNKNKLYFIHVFFPATNMSLFVPSEEPAQTIAVVLKDIVTQPGGELVFRKGDVVRQVMYECWKIGKDGQKKTQRLLQTPQTQEGTERPYKYVPLGSYRLMDIGGTSPQRYFVQTELPQVPDPEMVIRLRLVELLPQFFSSPYEIEQTLQQIASALCHKVHKVVDMLQQSPLLETPSTNHWIWMPPEMDVTSASPNEEVPTQQPNDPAAALAKARTAMFEGGDSHRG